MPASSPSTPKIKATIPRPLLAPPLDFPAPADTAAEAGVFCALVASPGVGPASPPAISSITPPFAMALIVGAGYSALGGPIQWISMASLYE